MTKIDTIASEIPLLRLAYYKDYYEDIERRWQLDDDLKIDVVDKNVLLNGFDLKKIFIDRNGNYGWLALRLPVGFCRYCHTFVRRRD